MTSIVERNYRLYFLSTKEEAQNFQVNSENSDECILVSAVSAKKAIISNISEDIEDMDDRGEGWVFCTDEFGEDASIHQYKYELKLSIKVG